MHDLPPLKEVIRKHGLSPRKSLGQNFLLNGAITDKIANAAGDLRDINVIEIGGGPGGLTRSLLKAKAKKVTVIEMDGRAVSALNELKEYYDNLEIIHGDALSMDLSLLAPSPRIIIANLPYNIATPLLIGWLHQIEKWQSLTLMFQKEVAQRITAAPNTKAYGRISVLSQWLCDIRTVMKLSPNSFSPPPKVFSQVVQFSPKVLPENSPNISVLEDITKAAFSQRRKMLRTTLCECLPAINDLGIDPTLRAENLTPSQYIDIAKHTASR